MLNSNYWKGVLANGNYGSIQYSLEKPKLNMFYVDYIKISDIEEKLWRYYQVKVGRLNPETNAPWADDAEKQAWISNKLLTESIKEASAKGKLAMDLSKIDFTMETLIKDFTSKTNLEKRTWHLYLHESNKIASDNGADINKEFSQELQTDLLRVLNLGYNNQSNDEMMNNLINDVIIIVKEYEVIDEDADVPKQIIKFLTLFKAIHGQPSIV